MKGLKILTIVFIAMYVCACSLPMPAFLKKDQQPNADSNKNVVNVIALLPVENHAKDNNATAMLRSKLYEELRFKGYPPIDTKVIDSKLKALTGDGAMKENSVIPPQVVEETLGVDGVMYCSLKESKKTSRLFYAPFTVSVECVLRSAKTGETLWHAESRSTSRSFDLFPLKLKMKSSGDMEAAMEEVVGKIMESLPYGPMLRG